MKTLYFITGSQDLYGEETLAQAAKDSKEMAAYLNEQLCGIAGVVFQPVVRNSSEALDICTKASSDKDCVGVIMWMHTFSPAKMWINALKALSKPMLHLHTQYNERLPYDSIDMDFMNLNQSAHGDREHGYIAARLRMNRKVVVGFWQDEDFTSQIGVWMRAAVGAAESRKLRVLRISDNMRNVAVTEGDKVEALIKLGWSVDHYGVGDIISEVEKVTEEEIDEQMLAYENNYIFDTDNTEAVRYQAREEVAIKKFLDRGNFKAFHTNFEDLQGLRQLPGLAAQDLMKQGYGFGAEGDWKVAAMTRIMKVMAEGIGKGTAFMEDYTLHLEKGNEMILGAHMLEVCPTIACEKPKIQVHPLGIGDREDPARLVFKAKKGPGIVVSLVDMGDRFRMIVNDIECQTQEHDMPKLPVAGVLWKPLPDFKTSAAAWIYAGGSHHSVLSYDLTAEHMRDFAEIMGIEFVYINKDTKIPEFRKELEYNDVIWRNK